MSNLIYSKETVSTKNQITIKKNDFTKKINFKLFIIKLLNNHMCWVTVNALILSCIWFELWA